MFEEHLLEVLKNTSTVRYIINTNEALRKTDFGKNVTEQPVTGKTAEFLSNLKQNAPNIRDWEVYDHCSVVTRLYAIYERFVEDLVRSWLKLIPKIFPSYLDLDERIKNTHQIGVGRLLLELNTFTHLTLMVEFLNHWYSQVVY